MAHKVKSDLQTDGKISVNTTDANATLDVNGAGNFSGGTVVSGTDTKTNIGVAIAKGTYLQSNDGNYLRQLIGHTSGNNIEIGQSGTGLIGNIQLKPGTSGNIIFEGSGSEDARFDSNGRLGIGTTSPNTKLEIKGTGGNASGLNLSNSNETFRQYFSDDAIGSSFLMTYDGNGGSDLQIQSDGDIIMANGTGGSVGIGENNPNYTLDVNGTVAITEYLYHKGDTDTHLRLTNDRIRLIAGGVNMLDITESASGQDQVVINENGLDVDFRIESDTEANALNLQGSDGSLQLGAYGSGTFTGTAAKMLAVDASGNVVEETLPSGGGVDGTGVAGAMTKWTDADTIEDSDYITENGTGVQFGTDALTYVAATKRVGINTSSPSVAFDCAGAAKFQSSFYDGSNNLAGDGQVLTGTSAGETLWRDPKDLAFKVMKTYYINVTAGSSGTFYLQHHGDEVTFSLNHESLFPVPSAGTLEKVSIVSSANYNGTTWSLVNASGGNIWTSGSINLTGNTTYQLTPSSASISATDRVAFKVVRGTAPFSQKIALTAIFAFE